MLKSKSAECYLIDLISIKKPLKTNTLNISQTNLTKIKKILTEKQNKFKGFNIVNKIINNLISPKKNAINISWMS